MSKFRELSAKPNRLYAVGDLHGCPDELEVLINYLKGTAQISERDQIIFIGDYIDRGPNSKKVLDMLLAFQREYPETIFLRGNHEDMLLGYLGFEGNMGSAFIGNGGDGTLESYGIDPYLPPEVLISALPSEHLSFFLNLDRYVITDKFIFVHAGLNPARDLRAQLDEDLFWIRDGFIKRPHDFGRTVVFGHTPFNELFIEHPYKIGIDTGLVYGNRLSCVEFVHRHIFQIERGGTRVVMSLLGGE